MSDAAETLRQARASLAAGEGQAAYRALLGLPPLEDLDLFVQAVGLLADLTRTFGAAELAGQIQAAADQPEDVRTLYTAAYGLYEERQFQPATMLLSQANRLAPGVPRIVAELAACLESQMLYRQAAQVLDETAIDDALFDYLSGFNRLMSGQIEAARSRLRQLTGPREEPLKSMRDYLADMLARADALLAAGIELGPLSLTAWQAVTNGTVLLHESPHGYEDAMRGRYAYLSDSGGLIRSGLERLKTVLPEAGFMPTQIVAAPGRPSQIVAAAASQLLSVPCVEWQPGRERHGLVVAWTLESVEDEDFLESLHQLHPEARLFAHGSCWTQPFAYSPDFTTLLYQHIVNPWTGGALQVPVGPDERDVEILAREILNSRPEDESPSSPEHVCKVARTVATWHPCRGPRLRQRAGGPVLSNYFS